MFVHLLVDVDFHVIIFSGVLYRVVSRQVEYGLNNPTISASSCLTTWRCGLPVTYLLTHLSMSRWPCQCRM